VRISQLDRTRTLQDTGRILQIDVLSALQCTARILKKTKKTNECGARHVYYKWTKILERITSGVTINLAYELYSVFRMASLCKMRRIASAGREVCELWVQESTAAENVRWRPRAPNPLVSPKAQFALGSRAGSESQTQRIEMLAGERRVIFRRKDPLFILEKSRVREFPFGVTRYRLSPRGADTAKRGYRWVRSRSAIFGFLRARLYLRRTSARQKDISGAPRRNVLHAGRSSSWCSARNDTISRCIVTVFICQKFNRIPLLIEKYNNVIVL